MKYNEYKAPKGKMLFNLDDFTCGNTILSAHDLNLVILDKEEAERLSKEYQEAKDKAQEEEMKAREQAEQEAFNQEQNVLQMRKAKARTISEDSIQTMELDENGEYVESIEDNNESVSDEVDNVNIKMEEFRKNNIATLLSKGVILNNKDIIHSVKETQFI